MRHRSRHQSAGTILVVSDLHLTAGLDPRTGRWSPTEDFFWDQEFSDFLRFHAERSRCTLVINGDWFDFLQVLELPDDGERSAFGIVPHDINRRFGLRCSESAAEFQLAKIIEGHPLLFRGLAGFVAAGNRLKIVKGNHDVHLFWPRVQRRLSSHIVSLVSAGKRSIARSNIQILPWVYLVPGLLFVEHGNQYEAATAFRNFLAPRLPVLRRGADPHIELDLSSLLVRYLTNRVEPFNPLADNIRPLSDFYLMLLRRHPVFALRTFGTALRFVWKASVKARELSTGRARRALEEIRRENERRIEAEAIDCGGGDPALSARLSAAFRGIVAGTPTPTLQGGPWKFLGQVTRGGAPVAGWIAAIYAFTFLPEAVRFLTRAAAEAGVAWVAEGISVLAALHVLEFLLAILAIGLGLSVRRLLKGKRTARHSQAAFPDVSISMREAASRISTALGVPYVTFGHTHYADTSPLPGGGRYFNTGTWMGVYESREQLYRDVHQFTFLRIDGKEAELLRWDPERGEPRGVVVMEAKEPLGDAGNVLERFAEPFRNA